jgi:hypothetical protein
MAETWTPALQEGEEILYHHQPSTGQFWRAMLRPVGIFALVLTLPFILFRNVFPDDTPWILILFVQIMVWVPVVIGVAIERAQLTNYEAYLTNRRAISRGFGAITLEDASHHVEHLRTGLRLTESDGINLPLEMRYPEDVDALNQAMDRVLKAAA